jgi:hypothetical protein
MTKRATQLISLRLPAAEFARVTRLAQKRKTTVSAVIREALEALDRPAEPSVWDQVRPLISEAGSGVGDLSTNREHLEGFGRS